MCENFIRINARGLVDQGVHNYLIHTGQLKSAYVYEYDETPVLHLGQMDGKDLRTDEVGRALNGSGKIANTVHQYEKHLQALQPSFAKMAAL
jgi:hypothetical protein